METLVTQIGILNQKVTLKYARLLVLVTELEAKQTGLSQVVDVVSLLDALTCSIEYHVPSHRVPTFTVPVLGG